ncbi:MAG: pyruvate dehydrogenase complex dihydrolipoamide acetyltransferase [Alphaproteobacteria bacterium]|uniref:Acetyltransferase component of pyruvate dehydrogenase complex n=1 Tax=PS1 clade bacterium TaxID=2175152 RepID=A0A368DK97_9PROT|nr:MAG: pyruvate dehydrogenase complex dihydrolipoamide acetyltransferase [PS1 clade bacterium]|tara:strand:+ start:15767 stop:17080 length:1314 start_codon:yes stop_codon:yes gene_type:complete
MSIKIYMPALSPTMEMGNLVKWLKKEGDSISSGEIIAEIETDKALMEYESADDGVLGKILIAEGTNDVKVNSPIAILLEEGESIDDLDNIDKKISIDDKTETFQDEVSSDAQSTSNVEQEKDMPLKANEGNIDSSNNKKESQVNLDIERKYISPLAKRIAEENNIDTREISGSGPNGRIVKKDIHQRINSESTGINVTDHESIVSLYNASNYSEKINDNMRLVIAKRLEESNLQIPSYTLNIDCSISKLNKVRNSMNEHFDNHQRLSINHFIIKITSMAMIKVPEVNSTWIGDKTLIHKNTDIGIAVAIENGLITPIIRDVQSKGLSAIRDDMKLLVEKARDKKLSPSEYQGGTISISNLGAYGIKNFTSIINPPQSSILSIGASRKIPVIEEEAVSIDEVISITLTADHRLIDGAVGANFISYMKEIIENPNLMLL